MSTPTHDRVDDHEIPSFEPWLRVAFAALVPSLAALFLPAALHAPAFALAGLLVLIAFAMLVVQERRKKRR